MDRVYLANLIQSDPRCDEGLTLVHSCLRHKQDRDYNLICTIYCLRLSFAFRSA